jgi:hypothetical protein
VESDFEKHVQKSHPDLTSANMLSALKRTSAKNADLGEQTQCSLCGKSMALRTLQRHLGSHQQQLALFALPLNLDNTEDDPNDDDGGSILAGNDDDEEHSDLSNTSDTAELLLDALQEAREEVEKKAATEAEETKKAHEKAMEEAKAAVAELEKAKKAAEEGAAKHKPSDAPKAPIKFKGRCWSQV